MWWLWCICMQQDLGTKAWSRRTKLLRTDVYASSATLQFPSCVLCHFRGCTESACTEAAGFLEVLDGFCTTLIDYFDWIMNINDSLLVYSLTLSRYFFQLFTITDSFPLSFQLRKSLSSYKNLQLFQLSDSTETLQLLASKRQLLTQREKRNAPSIGAPRLHEMKQLSAAFLCLGRARQRGLH